MMLPQEEVDAIGRPVASTREPQTPPVRELVAGLVRAGLHEVDVEAAGFRLRLRR